MNLVKRIRRMNIDERKKWFLERRAKIFNDFLKRKKGFGTPKKLLDIGCRDGALTSMFSVEEKYGIDFDEESLRKSFLQKLLKVKGEG